MKNKLLTFAGALALLATLGHFYANPLLAQVRAALVSDVDNPARGFVQLRFVAPGSGGVGFYYDPQYLVPAGKRLVIDTISAMSLQTNKSQPMHGLWLLEGPDAASCNSRAVFYSPVVIMPLTYQGNDNNGDYVYGGLAHVQSFADSGHCVAMRIDTNIAVSIFDSYQVTVSGHLVTYP
jgi:hypothetical protein